MTFLKICSILSLLFSLVLIIFSINSGPDWYLLVFSLGTGIGAFYMLNLRHIGIKIYGFFQVLSIIYFFVCVSTIEQTTIQNAQNNIETEQENEYESSYESRDPISDDIGGESQSVGEAVGEGLATGIQIAVAMALFTFLISISLISLIIQLYNYFNYKKNFQ